MNLEFKVQEYSRGDGTHHWEAVDCLNGKKIDFFKNNDGNDSMYGEYPSIQSYLLNEYNINMLLSYNFTNRDPDINEEHTECVWTFSDNNNEVKIIDIPRSYAHITVGKF